MSQIRQNTTSLQELLQVVNSLPAEGEESTEIELQEKTITPTKTTQIAFPDVGYDALSKVTVNPIPNEYTVPSGTKSVTSNGTHDVNDYKNVSVNVPIPDGYIKPSGTLTITENGTKNVTQYASVDVDIPDPELQDKTVTPTKSIQEVTSDRDYYGLSKVTVNPIPDEYISPSGVLPITENGVAVNVTDYAFAYVNIPDPELQSKTITPTRGTQTVSADIGYYGLDKVTINPIPSNYIIPSGTMDITENGTYDVTQKANVTVDVPTGSEIIKTMVSGNGTCSITAEDLEGITLIADHAFYHCHSLASITIPSGVTSIGMETFSSCTALTSVTIPASVTSIGKEAFFQCLNLRSISIPAGVTSIGDGAFKYCHSLSSITIPAGVTSIGMETFSNCTALTSVTIPESVTSIATNAFYNCTALTSVTIPESVTSIGMFSFGNCTNLTTISVQCMTPPTLNANAFYGSDNIAWIIVPSGCTAAYRTATNWSKYANKIAEEA